jgi:peptide/nickel transport system permease protein
VTGSPLLRYLARRLAFALLLVLFVSSASLLLARLAPGDYTAELMDGRMTAETLERERARLGLDRPFLAQYTSWLARLARLDLGTSFRYGRPVRDLIAERAGNTFLLALAALLLATVLGLPSGVLTGSRRGGVIPAVVRGLSILSLSVPPLISALLFAMLAARTGWFPIGGLSAGGEAGAGWLSAAGTLVWHLTLPALALALPLAAMLERLQSRALSEALREPCVIAALARGVPAERVVWRHGVRLAIKPVAAVYGILIGTLLSGSFAVEIVTAWPGLGSLMYEALRSRDIYLVAGSAAAGSLFLAAGTLASDLLLAAADPRLRETS